MPQCLFHVRIVSFGSNRTTRQNLDQIDNVQMYGSWLLIVSHTYTFTLMSWIESSWILSFARVALVKVVYCQSGRVYVCVCVCVCICVCSICDRVHVFVCCLYMYMYKKMYWWYLLPIGDETGAYENSVWCWCCVMSHTPVRMANLSAN